MNCDLCLYWEWRLKDLTLSHKKAPSHALRADIMRVAWRLAKHRIWAHWQRAEAQ
jgi:hypothetical protein